MSGYRYVEGEGAHFEVPTRDLTPEEFDALDPMQQRIVRLSPAYREISPAEAKKADEARRKQAEAEAKKADEEGQ